MKFKEWLAFNESSNIVSKHKSTGTPRGKQWIAGSDTFMKNTKSKIPYFDPALWSDPRFEFGPQKGDSDSIFKQGLDAVIGAHTAEMLRAMYPSGDRPIVSHSSGLTKGLIEPYAEMTIYLPKKLLFQVKPKNNKQILQLAVSEMQKEITAKGQEGAKIYRGLLWNQAAIVNGKQYLPKEGGDGSISVTLRIPRSMDIYKEPTEPDNLQFNYKPYSRRRKKKPGLPNINVGTGKAADSLKKNK